MTGIFTPPQRQNIYNHILSLLKDDDRVTGVLAIGKKDSAFRDDNDSIDLLVIIEKPSIIDIVFTLWVKRFEDLFADSTLFNFILNEDDHKFHLLLESYLQITLQFRAINRFHLVGDDWCIAYDPAQNIKHYVENRRLSREQHIQKTYEQHIRLIWYPIIGCVRELQRDNLWKANAQLETLRQHLIEIAGLRHLQFTQNYENMNLLPEMFLVQLRHTLPTTITDTAIRRSLKTALQMLFTETSALDAQFDTDHTSYLDEKLTEFVEIYG